MRTQAKPKLVRVPGTAKPSKRVRRSKLLTDKKVEPLLKISKVNFPPFEFNKSDPLKINGAL